MSENWLSGIYLQQTEQEKVRHRHGWLASGMAVVAHPGASLALSQANANTCHARQAPQVSWHLFTQVVKDVRAKLRHWYTVTWQKC